MTVKSSMVTRDDMFVMHGVSDGATTTETFNLDSELFYNAVKSVRIPSGVMIRVWSVDIDGGDDNGNLDGDGTVIVKYTPDITVDTPSWKKLFSITLVQGEGHKHIKFTDPFVIRGINDTSAIRVDWHQSNPSKKISTMIAIDFFSE